MKTQIFLAREYGLDVWLVQVLAGERLVARSKFFSEQAALRWGATLITKIETGGAHV